MRVTWLEHSSIMVQLPRKTLIFDYYGQPPLTLDPRRTTVFLNSHHHGDHWNRTILEYGSDQVWYVLSHDIFAPEDEHHRHVRADQTLQLEGIEIRTLPSTDEGVAMIVRTEGWSIYHAGDLNWWHWKADNAAEEADNQRMKQRYFEQLEKVAHQHFDLAMIPADPRLEEAYYWGLDAWMRRTETDWVIPMHFFGRNETIDRLKAQPQCQDYVGRILDLRNGPVELKKKGVKSCGD